MYNCQELIILKATSLRTRLPFCIFPYHVDGFFTLECSFFSEREETQGRMHPHLQMSPMRIRSPYISTYMMWIAFWREQAVGRVYVSTTVLVHSLCHVYTASTPNVWKHVGNYFSLLCFHWRHTHSYHSFSPVWACSSLLYKNVPAPSLPLDKKDSPCHHSADGVALHELSATCSFTVKVPSQKRKQHSFSSNSKSTSLVPTTYTRICMQ